MNRLIVLIAAAALAATAGNLTPLTALAPEVPAAPGEAVTRVTGNPPATAGRPVIGTVDTVGGTTVDWQANGPELRQIIVDPERGIHVLWMYSAANQTTFPDRNMRYNFYDFATGEWNWIDPDYMQSGVNVFTARSGYGNLALDWETGCALVSTHMGTGPLYPSLARDMAPGGGLFEYCDGPMAYLWPVVAAGNGLPYHVVLTDDGSRDQLYYSRVNPWCSWSSPTGVTAPQPEPLFPTQNIAASRLSQKVVVTWEYSEGTPDPGFYRQSTDGGTTWQNPEELPWPPAYGGDTLTSYHISAFTPFYDREDQLHIMASTMPYVAGQGYIIPAQIWHWSPDNSPNWSRVTIAKCNPLNLGAPVGYNAIYACRPSIGEAGGYLVAAWEQFDSSNVEPGPPQLLRADIFIAFDNGDNGATWQAPIKITDRTTGSHRFPSVAETNTGDVVRVAYEIDQKAGFFVQGENIATNNPMIVHTVDFTGIVEERTAPVGPLLAVGANPVRGRARLDYQLPAAGPVELAVFDAGGRRAATLVAGRQDAGRHGVTWDASGTRPGVYLVRLRAAGVDIARKLVLTE
jgi:hypothetical protein